MAKNNLSISAVYAITCCDGRVYVGSSICIKDRWKQHRNKLRTGVNANQALQQAWNELGEGAFEFTILEECPPESLIMVEQKWINHHKARGPLFNRALVAGSNSGVVPGRAVREKMSASRRGKIAGPETIKKLSAAKSGSRHPCAKIGDDDVREIRSLRTEGLTQQALADRFGISRSMVSFIISRARWAHI